LFAAWAGSIKFRIFQDIGQSNTVFFTPYHNLLDTGITIMDNSNLYNTWFAYKTDTYANTSNAGVCVAREKLYPISDEMGFIDISCPYQTNYNFNVTKASRYQLYPVTSGTLSYYKPPSGYSELYVAMGDDFRFGIFRPPIKTNFSLAVFDGGIGGFSSTTP
jgi:hypothetical protein